MGKYDDIINLERPKSNRPSMQRADRAKIFMPFAALKGYDEAIEEQQKLTTERVELSEEQKEELDRKLRSLGELISTGRKPSIKVIYFQPDLKKSSEEKRELGKYVEISGTLKGIDAILEVLLLEEVNIRMRDILEICNSSA